MRRTFRRRLSTINRAGVARAATLAAAVAGNGAALLNSYHCSHFNVQSGSGAGGEYGGAVGGGGGGGGSGSASSGAQSPGSPPAPAPAHPRLRAKEEELSAHGRASADAGGSSESEGECGGAGRGGGGGGAGRARAQYVSANCVVFTHYSGDVAAVVDEHFTRALALDKPKGQSAAPTLLYQANTAVQHMLSRRLFAAVRIITEVYTSYRQLLLK
ncbi:hypothetical protein MSG28_007819 [Choristoneura fumiferana]|uniref:Uncharacterized protein n=1 Tax=Choristoneura fumiferana TaxID=7141 RepID=A0ACC0JZ07_CHOFU|nr:hypothetical protein MSG28_007819 [Choristoneura fumiferana]